MGKARYATRVHSTENPEWALHQGMDERLNENRCPLHSVLREIQELIMSP
jgi:hypothetical protein